MKHYTPYQYMLIDIANQFGHDKELFEERIAWTKHHMPNLENLIPQAKKKALAEKAIHHLRKIQRGEPTGYMVSMDCTCSGLQILAAVSGCKKTAMAVNLIDPDERKDAYTDAVEAINDRLDTHEQVVTGGVITRDSVKPAIMTHFYGSMEKPKEIFDEGSPAYYAFLETMAEDFEGAETLKNELIAMWQPYVKSHSWTLPDGHTAFVPVYSFEDKKVEVAELGGATFTHRIYSNKGTESGLSLAANVTHSLDGYVVRELNRRCNYDKEQLLRVMEILQLELLGLDQPTTLVLKDAEVSMYDIHRIDDLTIEQKFKLLLTVKDVLSYPSFQMLSIHDDFWCSPLHMDRLRYNFIQVLADLADSKIIQHIMNELAGTTNGAYDKLSDDLGDLIRQSNYAIS